MKIHYYCLPYEGIFDGQAIYDRKLIGALRTLGHKVDVTVLNIKRDYLRLFPIWRREVTLNQVSDNDSLNIVSHEALIDICEFIRPDLFIVHNLFSHFEFRTKKIIEFLYRFNSFKTYKNAFKSSREVLFLSDRERRIASAIFDRDFFCEPPGLKTVEQLTLKLDKGVVKRAGSSTWLPKKLSLWSEKKVEQHIKNNGLEICYEDCNVRAISLIEDQFLSGFKLKLLEMCYSGDTIISSVDLTDELKALGLLQNNFLFVDNLDDFNMRSLLNDTRLFLTDSQVAEQQKLMASKYSWTSIAKRIVDKLTT
ncbi:MULTISPECIES: hypothetical protein [Shewanella]|uniref:hypothetical protein n=1 Tax=Shewanella TaxID=22 RepID=UPI001AAE76B2|nr:hypothetical protein [Shewanella algae]MBO2661850.1 hypothetical protein [Shewanella algae]MCL1053030.1 hypothetical protein [Shewanella algae]